MVRCGRDRHRRASSVVGTVACALGALLARGAEGSGDHAMEKPEAPPQGVMGLDVVASGSDGASGDVVDVLYGDVDGELVTLWHTRSTDGGAGWSTPVPIPTGPEGAYRPFRGADPQIAARGERLVAVWTVPGTSDWGDGPLQSARSADGGRTWTLGPRPADDGTTLGHGFADLAVDGDGAFHAVWLDHRDGNRGLRSSRSTDDGRTWDANASVDGCTCSCCWNALHARGREMLVLYRDKEPSDMSLARREGGAGWSGMGAVGAFGWSFEGCPEVGGSLGQVDGALLAVVWTGKEGEEGTYRLRSSDGGASWSDPVRVSYVPSARNGDLAVRGRSVAITYDDRLEGASSVRFVLSRDGGATWAAPRTLASGPRAPSHARIVATRGAFLVAFTEETEPGSRRFAWRVVKAAI